MQIKQQMLAQQISKKIHPLYILIGQDNYLIDEALSTIKSAIKKHCVYDEKIISVQSVEEWNTVSEEANSYSLFSETVLLNIVYDKKSMDAAGKKVLSEYLKSVNTRCFIIIRAANIPAKQLQWLSNNEHAMVVQSYPLTPDAMKNWIATQLKVNSFQYEAQVPELIHHFTQGNMIACSQVIEKITLSNVPGSKINSATAMEQLSDQCERSLFELVDACLLGKSDNATHIVRQASNNNSEATLVLWILSQEVRILLQLIYLTEQGVDIKTACSQLKVWPQRINLYQIALKRINSRTLRKMLHCCQSIDEHIKSSFNTQVWNSLEILAITLCTGRLLDDSCTL